MPATIKDIAKALGISPSTVSRALNDNPQIKEGTIKAVKAKAKELNYVPNRAAAGLRINKTYCIGVVVPNIGIYFFSRIISGMQRVASARGYQLLICQSNEKEEEEEKLLKSLSAGRVDGILLSISQETTRLNHIKEVMNHMPVVIFDRVDPALDTVQVEADDYNAAYIATQHLIKTGCKKIAHLAGPTSMFNTKNRLNGYKEALKDGDLEVSNSLIANCDFDRHVVGKELEKLLKEHPDVDGIFAVNDNLGVEAIIVLKKMGYKVPEQISVIGFGNYPISKIVEPRLTTVSHYLSETGERSARYLLEMIEKKTRKIDIEPPFVSELIFRDSTKQI